MLWDKGQERIKVEQELNQVAVREGMADVYVTLGRLRRTGPQRKARPKGLEGQQLHATLMAMSQQYPANVRVVSP